MGCDREEASLETARANAEANGVELALERLDVRETAPPVAPTVVANLTRNLLQDCSGHLQARRGSAPATLACSGMLESEIDEVATAFSPLGLDGEPAADRARVGRAAPATRAGGLMAPEPSPELPIAMFDSGVGGLTVLHECLVSLPEEDYVYLGDDARFPYGAAQPRTSSASTSSRSAATCWSAGRSCW